MKGAVPIDAMGTAPFNVYQQFQRVNRVLEYLAKSRSTSFATTDW